MLQAIVYAWAVWLLIGGVSYIRWALNQEPGNSLVKPTNHGRVYLQLVYLTVLGAVLGHFISG